MLPLLFLSGLSVPDHQPSWDLFLPLGCQLLMFGSGALSSSFSYLPLSSVFMLSFLCPFSRFVYTSRQLNVVLCIFSRLDIDEIMEGGLELDEVDGVRDMLTTKAVPFTQDHCPVSGSPAHKRIEMSHHWINMTTQNKLVLISGNLPLLKDKWTQRYQSEVKVLSFFLHLINHKQHYSVNLP